MNSHNVFAFFIPICITCYPPLKTINFGKYLRLFQIKPIKTMEFRFMQIGKKESKNETYCKLIYLFKFWKWKFFDNTNLNLRRMMKNSNLVFKLKTENSPEFFFLSQTLFRILSWIHLFKSSSFHGPNPRIFG